MKISKLFALMKQRKRIVVMQGKTAQWVGVIAVNEGMLLSALIVPVEVTDPVFRETLYRLYDFTRRQAGEEE